MFPEVIYGTSEFFPSDGLTRYYGHPGKILILNLTRDRPSTPGTYSYLCVGIHHILTGAIKETGSPVGEYFIIGTGEIDVQSNVNRNAWYSSLGAAIGRHFADINKFELDVQERILKIQEKFDKYLSGSSKIKRKIIDEYPEYII